LKQDANHTIFNLPQNQNQTQSLNLMMKKWIPWTLAWWILKMEKKIIFTLIN